MVFLPERWQLARDDFASWLQKAAGEAALVIVKTREEMEQEKQDADVLLGYCFDVTPDMWNLRCVGCAVRTNVLCNYLAEKL